MISTEPNIKPTDRLSISQAARAMQLNRETLYNYNRRGNLNIYYRRTNNRPYLLGKELLKIWNSTY